MQKALSYINKELSELYPESEIKSIGYLIIEKITGFSRTQLIVNKNTIFSDEQHHLIESFVQKLKKNIPIQYILGEEYFMGMKFQVNSSVLIPRPETEELIEWIVEGNGKKTGLRMLDIGTGSGCIAISLKSLFPESVVTAFDISVTALEVARSNANINHLSVGFQCVDILNPPLFQEKWDIIVSNPPYITHSEKTFMEPNVLKHEPHLALFVPDNDPLLFYRAIAIFGLKNMVDGGKLYFEINRAYGPETKTMLESLGYRQVELRKDISGNDRMIQAVK